MINDSRHISHKVIVADLTRVFKSKQINSDDIMEWCAQVEVRYMKDVDKMMMFVQIPLVVDVDNHQAALPCNVFRILDIYSNPTDDGSRVEFYNQGSYIILPSDYKMDTIYINYVGIPLSEEGEPLIIKGHENVCETFCKIKLFEEDVALGKANAQMFAMWQDAFSGQMTNARTDFRHFDRDYFNKLNVIRGNMIQKIGTMSLHHNNFS